jgi:putative peptidoglycan lipid II flippase
MSAAAAQLKTDAPAAGRGRDWKARLLTHLPMLGINAAGKVLGLLREVLVSATFGTGAVTDAYFGVQQLVLTAYNLMFGAFNVVFIAGFVDAQHRTETHRFVRRLVRVIVPALTLATLLGVIGFLAFQEPITRAMHLDRALVGNYLVRLAWAVPPIVLAGFAYGILHARAEHARAMLLAALGPAVMLASLAFLLHAAWIPKPQVLPVSFVAGSAVQGIWALAVLWPYRKAEAAPNPAPGRFPFWQQLGFSSVENLAFNANQMLTLYFAGISGAGAIAANGYASRIAMLALSGIMTPLGQAAQTGIARQQGPERHRQILRSIRRQFLIAAAIAAGMVLFRKPIVTLIYCRGAFLAQDVVATARLLVPYAAYFVVVAMNQLFARHLFVNSAGRFYVTCLLGGYLAANLLKAGLVPTYGLEGVLWGGVIGEGAAGLILLARLGRKASTPTAPSPCST